MNVCVFLSMFVAVVKTGGKAGKAVLTSGKSNVSFIAAAAAKLKLFVHSPQFCTVCEYV